MKPQRSLLKQCHEIRNHLPATFGTFVPRVILHISVVPPVVNTLLVKTVVSVVVSAVWRVLFTP
jgi:hypothetical protein